MVTLVSKRIFDMSRSLTVDTATKDCRSVARSACQPGPISAHGPKQLHFEAERASSRSPPQ